MSVFVIIMGDSAVSEVAEVSPAMDAEGCVRAELELQRGGLNLSTKVVNALVAAHANGDWGYLTVFQLKVAPAMPVDALWHATSLYSMHHEM